MGNQSSCKLHVWSMGGGGCEQFLLPCLYIHVSCCVSLTAAEEDDYGGGYHHPSQQQPGEDGDSDEEPRPIYRPSEDRLKLNLSTTSYDEFFMLFVFLFPLFNILYPPLECTV